jgi:hypothetical protein
MALIALMTTTNLKATSTTMTMVTFMGQIAITARNLRATP